MDGGSFENALGRIEAAIARIERAASQPAAAQPSAVDAELLARHEKLRAAVGQSLRQLDDLLASQPE